MRFNRLSRVEGAAYNSSAREFARGCLEGTRLGVLEDIHGWIRTGGTLLFWLNGVAGTGKSTIAHTIAQHYDSEGSRGASFFFSRDQQARRETRFLFQTIAFQLGNAHPALKLEIARVLEDLSILTSTLRHQFRRLIIDPVAMMGDSFSPAIIVLDALDECEDEDAVLHIIELLIAELADRSLPLKFLVTSRPHIQNVSVDDAAAQFHLPDLRSAMGDFFVLNLNHAERNGHRRSRPDCVLPWSHVNIWTSFRMQQHSAQDPRILLPTHTIQALAPSDTMPYGRCNIVLVNDVDGSGDRTASTGTDRESHTILSEI